MLLFLPHESKPFLVGVEMNMCRVDHRMSCMGAGGYVILLCKDSTSGKEAAFRLLLGCACGHPPVPL